MVEPRNCLAGLERPDAHDVNLASQARSYWPIPAR